MSILSWEKPWIIDGKLLLVLIILALGIDLLSTKFFLSQIENSGIPLENVLRMENNPLLSYYCQSAKNLGIGLFLHFIILTIGYTGLLSLSKISADPEKTETGEKSISFYINQGTIFFIALGIILAHLIVFLNNFLVYYYSSSILLGIGPLVLRILAIGGIIPLIVSLWKGKHLIKIDF